MKDDIIANAKNTESAIVMRGKTIVEIATIKINYNVDGEALGTNIARTLNEKGLSVEIKPEMKGNEIISESLIVKREI